MDKNRDPWKTLLTDITRSDCDECTVKFEPGELSSSKDVKGSCNKVSSDYDKSMEMRHGYSGKKLNANDSSENVLDVADEQQGSMNVREAPKQLRSTDSDAAKPTSSRHFNTLQSNSVQRWDSKNFGSGNLQLPNTSCGSITYHKVTLAPPISQVGLSSKDINGRPSFDKLGGSPKTLKLEQNEIAPQRHFHTNSKSSTEFEQAEDIKLEAMSESFHLFNEPSIMTNVVGRALENDVEYVLAEAEVKPALVTEPRSLNPNIKTDNETFQGLNVVSAGQEYVELDDLISKKLITPGEIKKKRGQLVCQSEIKSQFIKLEPASCNDNLTEINREVSACNADSILHSSIKQEINTSEEDCIPDEFSVRSPLEATSKRIKSFLTKLGGKRKERKEGHKSGKEQEVSDVSSTKLLVQAPEHAVNSVAPEQNKEPIEIVESPTENENRRTCEENVLKMHAKTPVKEPAVEENSMALYEKSLAVQVSSRSIQDSVSHGAEQTVHALGLSTCSTSEAEQTLPQLPSTTLCTLASEESNNGSGEQISPNEPSFVIEKSINTHCEKQSSVSITDNTCITGIESQTSACEASGDAETQLSLQDALSKKNGAEAQNLSSQIKTLPTTKESGVMHSKCSKTSKRIKRKKSNKPKVPKNTKKHDIPPHTRYESNRKSKGAANTIRVPSPSYGTLSGHENQIESIPENNVSDFGTNICHTDMSKEGKCPVVPPLSQNSVEPTPTKMNPNKELTETTKQQCSELAALKYIGENVSEPPTTELQIKIEPASSIQTDVSSVNDENFEHILGDVEIQGSLSISDDLNDTIRPVSLSYCGIRPTNDISGQVQSLCSEAPEESSPSHSIGTQMDLTEASPSVESSITLFLCDQCDFICHQQADLSVHKELHSKIKKEPNCESSSSDHLNLSSEARVVCSKERKTKKKEVKSQACQTDIKPILPLKKPALVKKIKSEPLEYGSVTEDGGQATCAEQEHTGQSPNGTSFPLRTPCVFEMDVNSADNVDAPTQTSGNPNTRTPVTVDEAGHTSSSTSSRSVLINPANNAMDVNSADNVDAPTRTSGNPNTRTPVTVDEAGNTSSSTSSRSVLINPANNAMDVNSVDNVDAPTQTSGNPNTRTPVTFDEAGHTSCGTSSRSVLINPANNAMDVNSADNVDAPTQTSGNPNTRTPVTVDEAGNTSCGTSSRSCFRDAANNPSNSKSPLAESDGYCGGSDSEVDSDDNFDEGAGFDDPGSPIFDTETTSTRSVEAQKAELMALSADMPRVSVVLKRLPVEISRNGGIKVSEYNPHAVVNKKPKIDSRAFPTLSGLLVRDRSSAKSVDSGPKMDSRAYPTLSNLLVKKHSSAGDIKSGPKMASRTFPTLSTQLARDTPPLKDTGRSDIPKPSRQVITKVDINSDINVEKPARKMKYVMYKEGSVYVGKMVECDEDDPVEDPYTSESGSKSEKSRKVGTPPLLGEEATLAKQVESDITSTSATESNSQLPVIGSEVASTSVAKSDILPGIEKVQAPAEPSNVIKNTGENPSTSKPRKRVEKAVVKKKTMSSSRLNVSSNSPALSAILTTPSRSRRNLHKCEGCSKTFACNRTLEEHKGTCVALLIDSDSDMSVATIIQSDKESSQLHDDIDDSMDDMPYNPGGSASEASSDESVLEESGMESENDIIMNNKEEYSNAQTQRHRQKSASLSGKRSSASARQGSGVKNGKLRYSVKKQGRVYVGRMEEDSRVKETKDLARTFSQPDAIGKGLPCVEVEVKEIGQLKNPEKYWCEDCDVNLGCKSAVEDHICDKHNYTLKSKDLESGTLYCNICCKTFKKRILCLRHRIYFHSPYLLLLKDKSTQYIFVPRDRSGKRVLMQRSYDYIRKRFVCALCDMTLNGCEMMTYHLDGHAEDILAKETVCNVCEEKFSTSMLMVRHKTFKHSGYILRGRGEELYGEPDKPPRSHTENGRKSKMSRKTRSIVPSEDSKQKGLQSKDTYEEAPVMPSSSSSANVTDPPSKLNESAGTVVDSSAINTDEDLSVEKRITQITDYASASVDNLAVDQETKQKEEEAKEVGENAACLPHPSPSVGELESMSGSCKRAIATDFHCMLNESGEGCTEVDCSTINDEVAVVEKGPSQAEDSADPPVDDLAVDKESSKFETENIKVDDNDRCFESILKESVVDEFQPGQKDNIASEDGETQGRRDAERGIEDGENISKRGDNSKMNEQIIEDGQSSVKDTDRSLEADASSLGDGRSSVKSIEQGSVESALDEASVMIESTEEVLSRDGKSEVTQEKLNNAESAADSCVEKGVKSTVGCKDVVVENSEVILELIKPTESDADLSDDEFFKKYYHTTEGRFGKIYQCRFCANINKKECFYRRHLIKHNPSWAIKCPCCGRSLPSRSHLPNHLDDCVKEYEFVCQYCGKEFLNKNRFMRHINKHERKKQGGRRVHICQVCNSSFGDIGRLRRHKFVKHGSKDEKLLERFVCPKCPKSFSTKYFLKVHMNEHEEGEKRRFQCELCGKYFKLNHHLRNHMETHSNVKKFECDVCSARFRLKHHLEEHKRRHRGEDYKCQYCDAKWSSKAYVLAHIRSVHPEKAKLYICKVCGKEFSKLKFLNEHVNTHSSMSRGYPHSADREEGVLLKCEYCPRRLPADQLMKHIELDHSDTRDADLGKVMEKKGSKSRTKSKINEVVSDAIGAGRRKSRSKAACEVVNEDNSDSDADGSDVSWAPIVDEAKSGHKRKMPKRRKRVIRYLEAQLSSEDEFDGECDVPNDPNSTFEKAEKSEVAVRSLIGKGKGREGIKRKINARRSGKGYVIGEDDGDALMEEVGIGISNVKTGGSGTKGIQRKGAADKSRSSGKTLTCKVESAESGDSRIEENREDCETTNSVGKGRRSRGLPRKSQDGSKRKLNDDSGITQTGPKKKLFVESEDEGEVDATSKPRIGKKRKGALQVELAHKKGRRC